MTLHPHGKQGVNISRSKYEQVRKAIVVALQSHDLLTFSELGQIVEESLAGRFEGSISWYYTTVKLDLEARGIIERRAEAGAQRIQLVNTDE